MLTRGRSIYRLTVIGFLLALLLGYAYPLRAAEDVTLSVSPPTLELSANPGETLRNQIRVENLSDDPVTVLTDARNFTALGEEGQAALTSENTTFSLASWMRVSPATAEIPAKGSQTFQLTITVPTNAEPGGHFGSMVFKTQPQAVRGGTGVAVGQEIGSLMFLRVAGPINEQAKIESFVVGKDEVKSQAAGGSTELTPALFILGGPIKFDTRIKNEGNVHVKPTGSITIADMFGRKVATLPLDSRNVLPDSIRKFRSEWKPQFLMGKYTATVALDYGDKKQNLTATTTFFAISKEAAIALGVLLLLLIIMFKGRRRLGKSLKVLFGR